MGFTVPRPRSSGPQLLYDQAGLTTPFLDRHNDPLQIHAEKKNGGIHLSDDGYILADLKATGLEIDTPKRKELFQSTLHGLGIRMRDNELYVEASEKTLGAKAQRLRTECRRRAGGRRVARLSERSEHTRIANEVNDR